MTLRANEPLFELLPLLLLRLRALFVFNSVGFVSKGLSAAFPAKGKRITSKDAKQRGRIALSREEICFFAPFTGSVTLSISIQFQEGLQIQEPSSRMQKSSPLFYIGKERAGEWARLETRSGSLTVK